MRSSISVTCSSMRTYCRPCRRRLRYRRIRSATGIEGIDIDLRDLSATARSFVLNYRCLSLSADPERTDAGPPARKSSGLLAKGAIELVIECYMPGLSIDVSAGACLREPEQIDIVSLSR
jgi:hypothetical protein